MEKSRTNISKTLSQPILEGLMFILKKLINVEVILFGDIYDNKKKGE
jgi:hypothetical protein